MFDIFAALISTTYIKILLLLDICTLSVNYLGKRLPFPSVLMF